MSGRSINDIGMGLKDAHRTTHKKLHEALDELVADYVTVTKKGLSNSTIMDLMQWSYTQTIEPIEPNQ